MTCRVHVLCAMWSEKGYAPAQPRLIYATPDHAISTMPGRTEETFPPGAPLLKGLRENTRKFGIHLFDIGQDGNGIVHIVGPEQGLTLPGTTLVCGDSHTCTHGGMGSLAFGIGSSELEHVLATQTMVQRKPKRFRVQFEGKVPEGVTAKDMILHLIGDARHGGRHGLCGRIRRLGGPRPARSRAGSRSAISRSRWARAPAWWRPTTPPSSTSPAATSRPRARCGTAPSRTGARCRPIPTPSSTASTRSTWPRWRRRSPGAPAPST